MAGICVWGPFFVHHFMEWVLFPKSDERLPNFVILAMLLHFRMLLGLFGIVLENRLSAWLTLVCAGGVLFGNHPRNGHLVFSRYRATGHP
ncbi:MAG: hypothetical protein EXS11_07710 [Gemmataceae bacterium]|nr:hypothetical protein [Gemmataceae bacterium]